jgi:sRNA-binding protein
MTKGRHHAERNRGAKEHSQQLPALREKWPLAFPVQTQDVRPLALGVADQIAAAMDWSVQYTLGVLRPWKMAPFYCRAVLSHDQRITLDGAPAETVDAGAKELAAKVLAKKAAAKPPAKPKPARPIARPTAR